MLPNKGLWTDKDGYLIYDRRVNGRRIRKRLHRYIMESHLGRKLLPNEIVHHKDHDKMNNDISNLEIIDGHKLHKTIHHPEPWNKGKLTVNKHKCQECGNIFETVRQPKRKYCSRQCSQKVATRIAMKKNRKHRTCTIRGCQNKHAARGYCRKHYMRNYTNGNFRSHL